MLVVGLAYGRNIIAGQLSPQETRTVRASAGRSIAAQLRPGDTEVIVTSIASPPLSVAPLPGVDPVEWLTSLSDVVIRVRSVGRTAALTTRGDWILSTVNTEIAEVLKNHARFELTVGSEWPMVLGGGQVNINGVAVRASVPWAREAHAGRTYLVFASVDEAGQLVTSPGSIFEETADDTVSLQTQGPQELLRLGRPPEVIQKIRAGR
jgi:hypothetical protein